MLLAVGKLGGLSGWVNREVCNVCVFFLEGKGKESQDGCMGREVWERVSKYWVNADAWIRFYCVYFVGLAKNRMEGREKSRWV